ncbi:MAG: trehalase family glycosidase, partial [Cyclobacteriaceae bacterium]|nr:trehalase family glycosidase [Cyclobacteriaceae bacterium]
FVLDNFLLPGTASGDFVSDTSMSMLRHIEDLWPYLTRQPDSIVEGTTLIPLPFKYVVPGGRFREIYYWDSYFTMEGLVASNHKDLAVSMVDNFAWLVDTVGFIPNGNRKYYSGRSQPPFFAMMVNLVAGNDRTLFLKYLPALEKEYNFWMRGVENLAPGNAVNRVVMLPDSLVLNRYYDDKEGPRPESFKPDFELVTENKLDEKSTYKHLRAGAESGWDYSSRWFRDHKTLKTIHTTEIIPIDLNCLLYFLEVKIAQGYNWEGDLKKADVYLEKANNRLTAIQNYLWDEEAGFYVDYDFVEAKPTGVLSLAGAYPLYFKLAPKNQAKRVIERLKTEFLMDGGFVTTLNSTGQQWDYPNGWAPLQWVTISALMQYGYNDDALDASRRWFNRNREVYKSTGKMMEKYNVADISLQAGGGEYALQDGFGWSNGIAVAVYKRFIELP